jgi:hypothetical protein
MTTGSIRFEATDPDVIADFYDAACRLADQYGITSLSGAWDATTTDEAEFWGPPDAA